MLELNVNIISKRSIATTYIVSGIENKLFEDTVTNPVNPVIDLDGTKRWYVNGVLHRTDGPAIEWPDGGKRWYVNGVLHRTDGPAVGYDDGGKEWWVDGVLHRTDGPAIEYPDGTKQWRVNGKLHRTNGPAAEYSHGGKQYWLLGDKYEDKDKLVFEAAAGILNALFPEMRTK